MAMPVFYQVVQIKRAFKSNTFRQSKISLISAIRKFLITKLLLSTKDYSNYSNLFEHEHKSLHSNGSIRDQVHACETFQEDCTNKTVSSV